MSRAFAARLATAAALLAVCVAALFLLPNGWWTAALIPVLLAASWEWGKLGGLSGVSRRIFSAVVLASAVLLWQAAPEPAGPAADRRHVIDIAVYTLGCAFWVLIAPVWVSGRWQVRAPLVLAVVGWIVLVPAWLALARLQADPARLIVLLGIVWLADSAAYLAGSAWGRRRLAPAVSPGKTWEGVAGAGAAVAVYYVLLSVFAPGGQWREGASGIALFMGVALMSVVGDLFESWIKRQAGVKDSGSLLPGHGGILDRADSLTSSMPIAALSLTFLG
ncbi:MAG: phosphatidate cytidylyltransferase [Betaproteobacteria bacterium]|nr:phosphatidate cytidylyltransferase [Betaproteobacteria bacterium]MBI2509993.1 phosphatidate cytidylyltransferase [Betaproteobacteria bacterium]